MLYDIDVYQRYKSACVGDMRRKNTISEQRQCAELIVYGGFKALNLSLLLYDRIANARPLLERAVI
jgi:hypothetical protein